MPTRRQFLQTAGAGLALAVVPGAALADPMAKDPKLGVRVESHLSEKDLRAIYKRVGDKFRADLTPEQRARWETFVNPRTPERLVLTSDTSLEFNFRPLGGMIVTGKSNPTYGCVWERMGWADLRPGMVVRFCREDGTISNEGLKGDMQLVLGWPAQSGLVWYVRTADIDWVEYHQEQPGGARELRATWELRPGGAFQVLPWERSLR